MIGSVLEFLFQMNCCFLILVKKNDTTSEIQFSLNFVSVIYKELGSGSSVESLKYHINTSTESKFTVPWNVKKQNEGKNGNCLILFVLSLLLGLIWGCSCHTKGLMKLVVHKKILDIVEILYEVWITVSYLACVSMLLWWLFSVDVIVMNFMVRFVYWFSSCKSLYSCTDSVFEVQIVYLNTFQT